MVGHKRLWEHLARGAVAVRDLVLPARCIGCDADFEAGAEGAPLCTACGLQIPRFSDATCDRCLAPVPAVGGLHLPCSYCRQWLPKFSRAVAIGPYEGLLRELVLRNKEDRTGVIAVALAALLRPRLREAVAGSLPDVVTAPPLHWRRALRQGQSPQSALGQRVAHSLGIPFDGRLLRLRRPVRKQVGLSHAGRLRNLHGEMRLGPGRRIDGARVLVVDDILTTGATCSEAARALLRAGAGDVVAAVAARTPP